MSNFDLYQTLNNDTHTSTPGVYNMMAVQVLAINQHLPFGTKLELEDRLINKGKGKYDVHNMDWAKRLRKTSLKRKRKKKELKRLIYIGKPNIHPYKVTYMKCFLVMKRLLEEEKSNIFKSNNNVVTAPCLYNIEKKISLKQFNSFHDFKKALRQLWLYYYINFEGNKEIILQTSIMSQLTEDCFCEVDQMADEDIEKNLKDSNFTLSSKPYIDFGNTDLTTAEQRKIPKISQGIVPPKFNVDKRNVNLNNSYLPNTGNINNFNSTFTNPPGRNISYNPNTNMSNLGYSLNVSMTPKGFLGPPLPNRMNTGPNRGMSNSGLMQNPTLMNNNSLLNNSNMNNRSSNNLNSSFSNHINKQSQQYKQSSRQLYQTSNTPNNQMNLTPVSPNQNYPPSLSQLNSSMRQDYTHNSSQMVRPKMSAEEKKILSDRIKSLEPGQLRGIIPILKEYFNKYNNSEEEKYFEFDLELLSEEQLKNLKIYVQQCFEENKKKKEAYHDNTRREKNYDFHQNLYQEDMENFKLNQPEFSSATSKPSFYNQQPHLTTPKKMRVDGDYLNVSQGIGNPMSPTPNVHPKGNFNQSSLLNNTNISMAMRQKNNWPANYQNTPSIQANHPGDAQNNTQNKGNLNDSDSGSFDYH